MKKVLTIIGILISFLIIYLLQSHFFVWFNIAGVKPNLFIILVIFIGLFLGKYVGFASGVIFGLALDLFTSKIIGVNAIALGITGLLPELIDRNFSKEKRVTVMLMVAGITLIYEIITYAIYIIICGVSIEILSFLKIIFIEAVFNAMIIIIIHPLFQKMRRKSHKSIKRKTRFYKILLIRGEKAE